MLSTGLALTAVLGSLGQAAALEPGLNLELLLEHYQKQGTEPSTFTATKHGITWLQNWLTLRHV
jgi:hypothetical protein